MPSDEIDDDGEPLPSTSEMFECSIGVLVTIAAIAYSGGSVGSPVSPSTSGTSGGSTTIRGTTNVAGASQSASQSASRASASRASTTIRVCISGTTTCADVDVLNT